MGEILVNSIPGGCRVKGGGPVRFSQFTREGRTYSRVSYPRAGRIRRVDLFPGQRLRAEEVTVVAEYKYGEPLLISSQGFDFLVLRNPEGSDPPYYLTDAPVLFPVTHRIGIPVQGEIKVGRGVFGWPGWYPPLPEHCFTLRSLSDQEFEIEEIGLQKGIKLAYVCGANEGVDRKVISHNLSILRGEPFILAMAMRYVSRGPSKPLQNLRFTLDAESGKLIRFVYRFEESGEPGVTFLQEHATHRLKRFTFYPKGTTFSPFLWYVLECTRVFYNRLEVV